ncbi:MAG: phage terminase large subunit, partial [Elioraea tepidiphila]
MTIPPVDLPEFVWIWNTRHGLDTPAHHRRIARWLSSREAAGDRRLLLMAFRGAGKSTLIGLWCAWHLLRRPDTRILVLAADQPLAVKMVAQVRRIVERHPLCRHLRPNTPEAWAADRFTVRRPGTLRDPSVLAAGIGGNITGARAEVIVCDDVEVAGNCDTPGKRQELRERLSEAEFVLVPGGTVLFVGTPHTADSLYLSPAEGGGFLRGYRRLVIPVVSPTGRPAWPERFPAAEVAALRERVGPLLFRRQMLLQAVAEEAARLDPALLVRYGEEPDYAEAGGRPLLRLLGRRLVSGGGFWDPAFGRPSGGDASVLAVTYADDQGNQYAHRIAYLTHDPEDAATDAATQQCRAVAAIARDLLLPVVRV